MIQKLAFDAAYNWAQLGDIQKVSGVGAIFLRSHKELQKQEF